MKPNPHGGDARTVASALGAESYPPIRLDFSVNINPLGPPPAVREVMMNGMALASSYPDVYAHSAEECLAQAHNVSAESVVVGNGSTEIFGWILQAFKPSRVSLIAPCYAGYEEACRASGIDCTVDAVAAAESGFAVTPELLDQLTGDMAFIGTPNNPTGHLISPAILLEAAKKHSERIFVIDEAFIDFCADSDQYTLIGPDLPENIIVVKSLTKFFAVPGLRLGMACANPLTVARINATRLPWSVNALAQSLAGKLYRNEEYIDASRRMTHELRLTLVDALKELPSLTIHASQANFVLVELPPHCAASHLQEQLLKQGILIRTCDNYEGLGASYCRLAVRPAHEIDELINAMRSILSNEQATLPEKAPHTPALMVVGTTSNAGKSIVAAGLCRFFARRGISVAPFKAQNMALNSFVTPEGGEMGRAQVVQAQAAGVDPHTDMNPVLLKPLGEDGSQVIVNGKAIGNFKAREYYAMKKRVSGAAHEAYDRLAESYDLIILEGAGSPAEINLQEEDFVNMAMADYAKAATILVADIDRGGVFASILGTVNLIPDKYRHLLKGIVINKFRGDESLLESGIKDIEAMTGIPVLGVLPYIRNIQIEDEDSQDLEDRPAEDDPLLDIAVVRLPRISNFTDFNALERTPRVRVRYVSDPSLLGEPDLIILPGTKSTCSDLRELKQSGWAERLGEAEKRIPIFGICGGYQMLGESVDDPDGVEGQPGSESGLGLLPLRTVMRESKSLAQVQGTTQTHLPFASAGTEFSGYEIHAGETLFLDGRNAPLTVLHRNSAEINEPAGCISESGTVFGCYIHGLFDATDFRHQLLKWLCQRKDIEAPAEMLNTDTDIDPYNRLADVQEKHLDAKAICALAQQTDSA